MGRSFWRRHLPEHISWRIVIAANIESSVTASRFARAYTLCMFPDHLGVVPEQHVVLFGNGPSRVLLDLAIPDPGGLHHRRSRAEAHIDILTVFVLLSMGELTGL